MWESRIIQRPAFRLLYKSIGTFLSAISISTFLLYSDRSKNFIDFQETSNTLLLKNSFWSFLRKATIYLFPPVSCGKTDTN